MLQFLVRHRDRLVLRDLVALADLIRKGYAAASIPEIQDVAGVSRGGFYHHFASKQEVGDAVLARQRQFFARVSEQAAAGPAPAVWLQALIDIVAALRGPAETAPGEGAGGHGRAYGGAGDRACGPPMGAARVRRRTSLGRRQGHRQSGGCGPRADRAGPVRVRPMRGRDGHRHRAGVPGVRGAAHRTEGWGWNWTRCPRRPSGSSPAGLVDLHGL
ncbi:TetR/AcrR family transcriptional regulator [Streptomyces sp. WY228]|nr:TetR/AcrR family transcriptional regulator [Streptomyces sp. WY228]